MKNSQITSFFNIFNQIQKVVNDLDLRSPHNYNVRIKEIKQSQQEDSENIEIILDIFNEYDAQMGYIGSFFIDAKFLDGNHKKELQDLTDSFVVKIHKNISNIEAA